MRVGGHPAVVAQGQSTGSSMGLTPGNCQLFHFFLFSFIWCLLTNGSLYFGMHICSIMCLHFLGLLWYLGPLCCLLFIGVLLATCVCWTPVNSENQLVIYASLTPFNNCTNPSQVYCIMVKHDGIHTRFSDLQGIVFVCVVFGCHIS